MTYIHNSFKKKKKNYISQTIDLLLEHEVTPQYHLHISPLRYFTKLSPCVFLPNNHCFQDASEHIKKHLKRP